jgi:15-cis-phytoene synthase
MSLDSCAALVARADPDRWAAVLAAPTHARAPLIVLYAYNIEISRAPWASAQPLIAQMRLQWWRDMLADPAPRAHEVAGPLHDLLAQGRLRADVLDRMAAARIWDIYSEPFDTEQDFLTYIEDTAGGLVWASAQALGAPPQAQEVARAYGRAQGLANFLRAVAELTARGRVPLRDSGDAAIMALAQKGLAALALARLQRRELRGGWPAVLACAQAGALLRRAARAPHLVRQGGLTLAPAPARARLIWSSLTRRV